MRSAPDGIFCQIPGRRPEGHTRTEGPPQAGRRPEGTPELRAARAGRRRPEGATSTRMNRESAAQTAAGAFWHLALNEVYMTDLATKFPWAGRHAMYMAMDKLRRQMLIAVDDAEAPMLFEPTPDVTRLDQARFNFPDRNVVLAGTTTGKLFRAARVASGLAWHRAHRTRLQPYAPKQENQYTLPQPPTASRPPLRRTTPGPCVTTRARRTQWA